MGGQGKAQLGLISIMSTIDDYCSYDSATQKTLVVGIYFFLKYNAHPGVFLYQTATF